VVATSTIPLDHAELVAANGRFVRSDPVQPDAPTGGGVRPSFGIGGFGSSGGSFGTGVGIGFPLGGSPPPPPNPLRFHARVPIPDRDEYQRDWQRMIVRLYFGTPPGTQSTAEVPAPAPKTN
jgi:hypothetical protein